MAIIILVGITVYISEFIMTEKKEKRDGFAEKEALPLNPPPMNKLKKKGDMSACFESALDAVENMEKKNHH